MTTKVTQKGLNVTLYVHCLVRI